MDSIFQKRGAGYIAAVLGIAAVTAICAPFHDQLNHTTVALALLLVVLFVATVWGSWPALIASVLGMLCFNFFFLPPVYTFTIADPQNWVALAAFFITAITAGQLSELAKRRAAEAEAVRKETRLRSAYNRSLLEASLDPLVTIGSDGKIDDVNSAIETVTGRSRADLIGTDFSTYFTEPEKVRAVYQEVLREGFVRDYALELRHRDGHVTSVLYNASLYRDDSGKVIGVVAAARSISTSAGKPVSALSDPRVVSALNRFVGFTSLFSVTVGLLALIGWMFGIAVLKSVIPGQVIMKPNAAACLVLIGFSLWLLRKKDDRPFPHLKKLAGQLLATIVALVGLLCLMEHIFGWDLGIDQLLFLDEKPWEAFGSVRPGLIAPITALDFLLLGLALIFLDWTIRLRSRLYWPAQFLAFLAGVGAIVGLLDFVLGTHTSYTHIALQAAVTLLLLSCGLVSARTEEGLGGLLTSSSVGGALTRRLLPAAVIVPLVIGTLAWTTYAAGLFSEWGSGALMTVAMIVLLGSLTLWNGYIIDRSDSERRKAEGSLRRREEELREAQRLARVGNWWWDPKADSVTWSEGLYRIAGHDPKLPPPGYKEQSRFYTPESFVRLEAAVEKAIQTGTPYELELEMIHADGAIRSVTSRGEAERDAAGLVVLVRGTVQDVTELKQAEAEVRSSEARHAATVQVSLDAIIAIDARGGITEFNPAAEQMFGHRREDVLGRDISDVIIPPSLRESHRQGLARYLATGEAKVLGRRVELTGIRASGEEFPVELAIARITSTGPAQFTAYIGDISERKRAEEALRQSEANLNRAQGIAHIGSWYLDVTHNCLTWSNEVFRIFGLPKGTPLTYDAFLGSIHPEDRENVGKAWTAALHGAPYDIEHRIVVDGTVKWVRERAKVEFDNAGNAVEGTGTVQDITEHKQAEDEIKLLARLQAIVAELGERALRIVPLSDVLDDAVTRVTRALDVDYCNVMEIHPGGDELLLRAGVGWKEGSVGRVTVQLMDSQPGYTVRSDRPVIVEDAATETRFVPLPRLLGEEAVSAMSVVIPTTEGPYGTLGAHSRYRRTFTKDEVNFLQTVANVLGSAIERHRAEAQLLRINRANRALSQCNQALVRATEEATLLQRICQIIVEETGYRLCWVGTAENDEAKSVRPLAQAGFEEGYLSTLNITWADTERGQGPTGMCIRTRQIVLVKNIATDPTMIPWRAEALKRGYASSVAIPLITDSAFGALTIYAQEPEAFGVEEVKLLTELASDLGFGIATLRTRRERARAEEEIRTLNAELEQRVIARTADLQTANKLKDELLMREQAASAELAQAREQEIEIGYRIQQTLLLDQPPRDISGLRMAALTIPSQRIDGDFYIFFKHPHQRLDVIVGDVMGKGVPAALLGAATKSHFIEALSHLTALSKDGKLPEPKEIVTLAHAELAPHLINLESFVTLCYVRLDLDQCNLVLVDCGHTGLIHLHRKTGLCDLIHGDNLPLGVREGEIYDQISLPFEPGDVVIFYSDGVTEARNSAGELFGVDRLTECVRINRDLEPEALVEAIRKAAFTFSGADRLTDDLTCVAVKVVERQASLVRAEIELGSDHKELGRARRFVRAFCRNLPGAPLDEESVGKLELAVTEACSNIMKHAYHGRADQWIHLEAEAFPGSVSIRLHHLGDSFDPSKVPLPALDGSQTSGFGMYLITQSVDDVRYYLDERGRNCIALVKVRK